MGLYEWTSRKLRQKINEELPKDENENLVNNDEIEKASYSEYSYKKVQKLREKAKYYGYDVPYLQHPLTKVEKPRALFVVFGVLNAILLAFSIFLSVMITINFLMPLINMALGLNSWFVPKAWDVFGVVTMFSSVVPLMVWLIIIATVGLMVAIVVFFVYNTRRMFSLSKISMEEMAVGYEISNMILGFIIVIVSVVLIGVFLLVKFENIKTLGIVLVVGIMVAVTAILGTLIALLMVYRKKAKKQFNELPQDVQKSFIEHNRVLERVNRLSNKNSKSIISSSKVDF